MKPFGTKCGPTVRIWNAASGFVMKCLCEECPPFDCEQLAFNIQSAGVSGQRPLLSDDAVTGDYDRNAIFVIRHADGARRPRFPDRLRDFAVGSCLAVGNLEQSIPNRKLKRSAVQVER